MLRQLAARSKSPDAPLETGMPRETWVSWTVLTRLGIVLCLTVLSGIVIDGASLSAQEEATTPAATDTVATPPVRPLTPDVATFQVVRKSIQLGITNAYQPDGIRWLAIQLDFQNQGTEEVTVLTKGSQLVVGNDELLRVQVNEELRNIPLGLDLNRDEDGSEISEYFPEALQGASPVAVAPQGGTAQAWLVFAPLPHTRELPPLTLRLVTSLGKLEFALTQYENDGLTTQLERIGPAGCVGIMRVTGDINAININQFANTLQTISEQGVSRLVLSFNQNSRIGDDQTRQWIERVDTEDNERLQYFPRWPATIRRIVIVNLPGQDDETDDHLAMNEPDAVQSVTSDLMPHLPLQTLLHELQNGHPLIRRAVIMNSGEIVANAAPEDVIKLLQPGSPAAGDLRYRHAAIASLRGAIAPACLETLTQIVRQAPATDVLVALRTLNASQLERGRSLAVELMSDKSIQGRISVALAIQTIGIHGQERWSPFLKEMFQNDNDFVRNSALEQLLILESGDRFDILQKALSDPYPSIRERAFLALLASRSDRETPLFVREALARLKSGNVSEETLRALREIRDPATLPELLKRIDENPDNSLSLVITYAETGGQAAVHELTQRFSRLGSDSRVYLLRSLFQSRVPDANTWAKAGLLAEENELQELAIQFLVEAGNAAAVETLLEALREIAPINAVRGEELARAIGRIGTEEARRALKSLSEDSNGRLRQLAESGMNTTQFAAPINYWLEMAQARANEKDFEGAIQILRLALEVDPQSARIYNSLGYAYLNLSRDAEALSNFEVARKISPDDHNPLTGIAICLAKAGQCDEAIAMVDQPKLLIKFGNQQIYLYNVACVYGRCIEQRLKSPDTPERKKLLKKYQERAIRCLNASIEQGFDNTRLLTSDPDLNTLRDLPEFKKLSTKIMGKN